MIIARATDGTENEILLLGLSRGNINRLTAGQPIRISRETHGEGIPEGWKICILFGETEEQMRRWLEEAGAIGPKTEVNVDPRLNEDR